MTIQFTSFSVTGLTESKTTPTKNLNLANLAYTSILTYFRQEKKKLCSDLQTFACPANIFR